MKTLEKANQDNEKINVEQQKHNFVVIQDTLYKTKLNILECGLLFKLITRAPTFKTTKLNLARVLNCSKENIETATKGLKEKGILKVENNFKGGSKWTINQEPIINKINNFNFENILDALTRCIINTNDLKQLYKLKYIDYSMYQKILIAYKKEIDRIIHFNAYEDDE